MQAATTFVTSQPSETYLMIPGMNTPVNSDTKRPYMLTIRKDQGVEDQFSTKLLLMVEPRESEVLFYGDYCLIGSNKNLIKFLESVSPSIDWTSFLNDLKKGQSKDVHLLLTDQQAKSIG